MNLHLFTLLLLEFSRLHASTTANTNNGFASSDEDFEKKVKELNSELFLSDNRKRDGKINMNQKNGEFTLRKGCIEYGNYQNSNVLMCYSDNKIFKCCCDDIDLGSIALSSYSELSENGIGIYPNFINYDFHPSEDGFLMNSVSKMLYGRSFNLKLKKLKIIDHSKPFELRQDKYSVKDEFDVATLILFLPDLCLIKETNFNVESDPIRFNFLNKKNSSINWICYYDEPNDNEIDFDRTTRLMLVYRVILTEEIDWRNIYSTLKVYESANIFVSNFVKNLENHVCKDKTHMGLFLNKRLKYNYSYEEDVDLLRHLDGMDLFFFIKLKEHNYHPTLCSLYSNIIFTGPKNSSEIKIYNNGDSKNILDNFSAVNDPKYKIFYDDKISEEVEYVKFGKRGKWYCFYDDFFSYWSTQIEIKNLLLLNQETKYNVQIPYYFENDCDIFCINNVKGKIRVYTNVAMVWRIDGKESD